VTVRTDFSNGRFSMVDWLKKGEEAICAMLGEIAVGPRIRSGLNTSIFHTALWRTTFARLSFSGLSEGACQGAL